MDWQPIETAPKDGTNIDVWFVLHDGHSARWPNCLWDMKREVWLRGPLSQYEGGWVATHWMPLPAPPQDKTS